MKRTTKTIMAFLTAMTMTAGSALSVSATTTPEDSDIIAVFDNGAENDVDNGTVYYDLNNDAYIEKVNSYVGKIAMEEEFLEYLDQTRPKTIRFSDDGVNFHNSSTPVPKHIYKAREDFISPHHVDIVVESANSKNVRTFEFCEFYFEDHMFRNNDELMSKYTVDEMNDFLKAEGFKAHLTLETKKDWESDISYYALHYDDRSEENVFGTFLALYKKYGAVVNACGLVTAEEYYSDETSSVNGDANDDNITNVRDCAFIATAIANGKADTLPDAADYNKDGKKNVRDAAALSSDLAAK